MLQLLIDGDDADDQTTSHEYNHFLYDIVTTTRSSAHCSIPSKFSQHVP